MKKRMLLLVAIASACGEDSNPIDPAPGPLEGTWAFEQQVGNLNEAVGCQLEGVVELSHSASGLAGQLSLTRRLCVFLVNGSAPGGPQFDSALVDVDPVLREGSLVGGELSFRFDWCTYAGLVTDALPQEVEGTTACTLNIEGEYTDVRVEGTWRVTRM